MRKICAVSFITFVFSTIASAQLPSGGDAFFAYSYVHGEAFSNSRTVQATGGTANMSGWETSVEGKYLPWLGAVADLDWHYGGHNTFSCGISGACTKFRLNASREDTPGNCLYVEQLAVVPHHGAGSASLTCHRRAERQFSSWRAVALSLLPFRLPRQRRWFERAAASA